MEEVHLLHKVAVPQKSRALKETHQTHEQLFNLHTQSAIFIVQYPYTSSEFPIHNIPVYIYIFIYMFFL